MIAVVIWVLLVVLHIVGCVLVYMGMKTHVLKVKKSMMPIVVFVPLWGFICTLFIHFQIFADQADRKKAGIEKLKVNEEIYKNIFVADTGNDKEIVPLEEALIINSPEKRRNLIMDVLSDNPEEYIDILHEARMNEDAEVVHYAATAMAEISKEYDLRLQRLEQSYAAHPEDEKVLDAYLEVLEEYIRQDIVKGQMLIMQRTQFDRLLKKKVENNGDLSTYLMMAENLIELKNYTGAGEVIQKMTELWPEREEVWLIMIHYYSRQRQGDKLKETIRQIKERHIYMSAEGQEILAFWQKKG